MAESKKSSKLESSTLDVEDNIEETGQKEIASLLSLSWEDVVFSNIFRHFDLADLFRARGTCFQYKLMVDEYFLQMKILDLATLSSQFSTDAFKVLSSQCTNLRKLVTTNARWILDKDLSTLFKNNRELLFLDISGCVSLNGTCLLTLAVNCKKLNTLLLRDCNWLTHGAVETLIMHLDSLEVVDLSSCSAMSNQHLIPFLQKFYRMKELHIANLQSINDMTLLAIARTCYNLKILDMHGCGNITDRGIGMIAEYCKHLTSLFVLSCNLVTEYSLRLLRSRGVEIDRERAGEMVLYVPLNVQV